MEKGPWETDPPDPVEKDPPDFSGFVLVIIGFILLGVAGWALMNWTMPDLTPSSTTYSTRRFLLHNPFISLVLIGLVLLVAQVIKKK